MSIQLPQNVIRSKADDISFLEVHWILNLANPFTVAYSIIYFQILNIKFTFISVSYGIIICRSYLFIYLLLTAIFEKTQLIY